MIRLTAEDKKELIRRIKSTWHGCMCDECLLLIVKIGLHYQLEKNEHGSSDSKDQNTE